MATKPDRMIIKEPQVLVFKEKHGERYFHIPNDETLFAAALQVLTEREKDGYWYEKPAGDKPELPDVTEEQIATLPKSLQAAAAQKLREYKNAMRDYQECVGLYADITKAISEKNGRLAWQVLGDYADGEYQGYDLERYEKIEP